MDGGSSSTKEKGSEEKSGKEKSSEEKSGEEEGSFQEKTRRLSALIYAKRCSFFAVRGHECSSSKKYLCEFYCKKEVLYIGFVREPRWLP